MKHCLFIVALALLLLTAQPLLGKQIKGVIFDINSNEIEILVPTGKTPDVGMHVEVFRQSEKNKKQSIGIWTVTRTDINMAYAIPFKTTGRPQVGYTALIGPPKQYPEQRPQAVTPPPAPEPAPLPKTAPPPPEKKITRKKPPAKKRISLSGTDQRLFNDLSSKDPRRIRSAARELCRGNYRSPVIMDRAAKTLQQQYNPPRASSMNIDAMAWICKALWISGKAKYIDILQEVEANARHGKLRKYAYKYRRGLEKKNRCRRRR